MNANPTLSLDENGANVITWDNTTIVMGWSDYTGTVEYNFSTGLTFYDNETGEYEALDMNLPTLPTGPGEVIIKAEAEHLGLAESLEEAGIAVVGERISYGPFGTLAITMHINWKE